MRNKMIFLLGVSMLISSCGGSSSSDQTNDETAQQVGDSMSSLDEMGGSTGSLALLNMNSGSAFAELNHSPANKLFEIFDLIAPVSAAACRTAATFSDCSSSSRTRTFSGCTIGSTTWTGSVALAFSDSSCSMSATSNSVARSPSLTVTGKSGGTLTVSKTGTVGQKITKTGTGTFSFSNDGIRRVIADSNGTSIHDFTTTTTSDVTVTGASRSGRTLNGGAFHIVNNLKSTSCDITPSDVTWTSACNCATSGTWAGTCTGGKVFTISITGCGEATVTNGTESAAVTFDRCYGI